jgi:hypothetical protein
MVIPPMSPQNPHASFPRMIHPAPSFRAQKFPEAMSFSTSFSWLNFDTRRFSFAFSCSNSFSRRAWPPVSHRTLSASDSTFVR